MVIGKFPKESFGESHGTVLAPLPAQDFLSPFGVIGVKKQFQKQKYTRASEKVGLMGGLWTLEDDRVY